MFYYLSVMHSTEIVFRRTGKTKSILKRVFLMQGSYRRSYVKSCFYFDNFQRIEKEEEAIVENFGTSGEDSDSHAKAR